MGRRVAILWHASFSVAAGVLYFFFVLPRWPELMGETTHSLGTTLRIVTGALIGLAALPVVFTLLRSRKPELGTPQMALSLRVKSIVAHVLAGVLIIGTAISEIWLSLDNAGQYLFAIYGAAAAIALLGLFDFYLSFVAELPPPPPKPIKAKKPKRSRVRRKKGDETDEADEDLTDEEEEEADEAEEPETAEAEETPEAEKPAEVTAETVEAPAEPESPTEEASTDEDAESDDDAEESKSGLRNRRPTGKGSHRMRRRTRGGVAVEDE
jgi:outer membrane biosynthesis protein TonB